MDQEQFQRNLQLYGQSLQLKAAAEANRIAEENAAATRELRRSQEQQRTLEQQRLAVEQQRLQEEKRRTELAAQEQERRREAAEKEAEEKKTQAEKLKALRGEMVSLEDEISELHASLSHPRSQPKNVLGGARETYSFLLLQKKLKKLLSKKSSLRDLEDIRFLRKLEKSIEKLPQSFPSLCGDEPARNAREYVKNLVKWPSRSVTHEEVEVSPTNCLQKVRETTWSMLETLEEADSELHSTESIERFLEKLAEQEQLLALAEGALNSLWSTVSPQIEELVSIGVGLVEMRILRGSNVPHLSECLVPVARLRQSHHVCRGIVQRIGECRERDRQRVTKASDFLGDRDLLQAYSTIADFGSRVWSDIGLESLKTEYDRFHAAEIQRCLSEIDTIAASNKIAAIRKADAMIGQYERIQSIASTLRSKREDLAKTLELELLEELSKLRGRNLKSAIKRGGELTLETQGLDRVQASLETRVSSFKVAALDGEIRRNRIFQGLFFLVLGISGVACVLGEENVRHLLGSDLAAKLNSLYLFPTVAIISGLAWIRTFSVEGRIEKLKKKTEAEQQKARRKGLAGEPVIVSQPDATQIEQRPSSKVSSLDLDHVRFLLEDCSELKFIPAGKFLMGQEGLKEKRAEPVRTVNVRPFLIGTTLVTHGEWQTVMAWALANGYDFTWPGQGGGSKHPATEMGWYDAIKWCNAKSEFEGLSPCYGSKGEVYRTGEDSGVMCDWDTTGYRLPTEAEWEKAARGGLVGKKFANGDFLDKEDAHVAPKIGTVDVGKYPANGYGLYDVDGNACQWCWDWYQPSYKSAGVSDPRGPERGDEKVFRGGCYVLCPDLATRFKLIPRVNIDPSTQPQSVVIPKYRDGTLGFRWARAAIL